MADHQALQEPVEETPHGALASAAVPRPLQLEATNAGGSPLTTTADAAPSHGDQAPGARDPNDDGAPLTTTVHAAPRDGGQDPRAHARVRSMIVYEVASGHKRKAHDVLVENEREKVRLAVVTEDNKRKKNPEKYPASEESEEKLVIRLLKRYTHMTKATMKNEIAKIRAEDKPDPAAKVAMLEARLKMAREALKIAKRGSNESSRLQLEKKDLQAQLTQLRDEVQAGRQLEYEFNRLKHEFHANVEHKRKLEEKLELAQADLANAQSEGSAVSELERQVNDLKTKLWGVQNESKATQERAQKWEEE